MRAYGAAMFLLVAHAFYKALMFLGAGSVIHGHARRAGHEEDGRAAPSRCRSRSSTFVIGGARPWRGSRRSPASSRRTPLLEVANHTGREVVFVLVTLAAFLTAFYIGADDR